ncbi:P27 family phage terminase small subunit [Caballeronia sordidicola]|uniref:P27 family phage terminase small subunit n=1 Tax=Caballeronia sordidicola TaxID=196367 RepID=UPI001177A4DD|nr:P27 family phage terminase small subunit [Caballeronia sordidicola]
MNEVRKRRTKAELAIARLPQCPSGLSENAYAFWPMIVNSRLEVDWNPLDLEIAGRLCEAMAMHKSAVQSLAGQSLMVETVKSRIAVSVPNPLIAIISNMAADIRSWYRTLGLKSPIMPTRLADRANNAKEVIDDSDDFPVYN